MVRDIWQGASLEHSRQCGRFSQPRPGCPSFQRRILQSLAVSRPGFSIIFLMSANVRVRIKRTMTNSQENLGFLTSFWSRLSIETSSCLGEWALQMACVYFQVQAVGFPRFSGHLFIHLHAFPALRAAASIVPKAWCVRCAVEISGAGIYLIVIAERVGLEWCYMHESYAYFKPASA